MDPVEESGNSRQSLPHNGPGAFASGSCSRAPGARLLDLPSELVIQILTHLAGQYDALRALAQTCRLLQHESEKYIYRKIELFSTNDLHAILEAFSRRPERVESVETLRVLYRYHDDLGATSGVRADFNKHVAKMKALREWHVESPYDNFKWTYGGHEWVEQDMECFRHALEAATLHWQQGKLKHNELGLSKLEKLILHSHGADTDFWDLGGFHCLFHHPALRFLHISCIILPDDIPELACFEGTTPLTTLVFDECEIKPKSLGRILRTPKALKHLTLGENVYNSRSSSVNANLSLAPAASLKALKAVAHSLESITHYDPYWLIVYGRGKKLSVPGNGMLDFHRLRIMDVPPCSFLHHCLLAHAQAPPNLETLRLRCPREHGVQSIIFNLIGMTFLDQLPAFEPYTYLPSLKTLEFIQGVNYYNMPQDINDEQSIRDWHSYAFKLRQHGVAMKFYIEATLRSGLIPPYLHGEELPETVCIYDSEKVGFRRRVHDAPVDSVNRDAGGDASAMEMAPELKELPETDQLSDEDVLRLGNQVRRALQRLDTLYDNEEVSEHGVLGSTGSEDDVQDSDWFDADEFDEIDEDMEDDLQNLDSDLVQEDEEVTDYDDDGMD